LLAAGAAFAFKEFENAQKISNQTAAVLESTGGAANVTAKEVENLSLALARKTGIDDETIQSGENLLLTFRNIRNEAGKGNDIFNQTTEVITDMSVALGTDLNSAAIQVGKALQDPTVGLTALRRVGVSFTEQQSEMIQKLFESGERLKAQKIILHELTTEFGGSAEAQATASAKLGVAFGNLAEVVGELVAPVFQFLAEALHDLVKFLQSEAGPVFEKVMDWFRGVWESIQPVAEVVGAILLPLFERAWHAIRDRLIPALEKFEPVFKLIGLAVITFATILGAQIAIAIVVISHVIDIIGKILDAFMKVVSWVRENLAEPIVGAIQKVIDWLQRAAEFVGEKFGAAWQAIKGPVLAVIAAIGGAIRTLIGWVQNLIDLLTALPELLGSIGSDFTPPRGAPHLNPPQAQTGGFVARSGLAVIHRGENIVPAGMGGVNITINGWVGNDQQLARKIRDELNKLGGRNAGTGLN